MLLHKPLLLWLVDWLLRPVHLIHPEHGLNLLAMDRLLKSISKHGVVEGVDRPLLDVMLMV
jgi:hypothetical protein